MSDKRQIGVEEYLALQEDHSGLQRGNRRLLEKLRDLREEYLALTLEYEALKRENRRLRVQLQLARAALDNESDRRQFIPSFCS